MHFNIGQIEGGRAPNVIPDHASHSYSSASSVRLKNYASAFQTLLPAKPKLSSS